MTDYNGYVLTPSMKFFVEQGFELSLIENGGNFRPKSLYNVKHQNYIIANVDLKTNKIDIISGFYDRNGRVCFEEETITFHISDIFTDKKQEIINLLNKCKKDLKEIEVERKRNKIEGDFI